MTNERDHPRRGDHRTVSIHQRQAMTGLRAHLKSLVKGATK
jgi:hypothetical protein